MESPLLTIDDLIAGVSVGSVHQTLAPATSLTGSVNSPATSTDANDPGLDAKSRYTGVIPPMMSKNWLWIILAIVAIVAALWYFGGASAGAAVSIGG